MRFNKIKQLVHLLFLYFKRTILHLHLLRNKWFRVVLLLLITLFVGGLAFLLYEFFTSTNSQLGQTQIILDTYGCSVFMWTYAVFLFIKILFIKKDSFTLFTIQLPVSRKELNVALLVFELVLALSTILLLSSSMVLALIAKYGTYFLPRIACNIYFLSITIYLCLELFYAVLNAFFDFCNLAQIKIVLIISSLSGLLILFYTSIIPKIFQMLLFGYRDGKQTSKLLIYSYINEHYGFLPAFLLFVLVATLLLALIILFPNRQLAKNNTYLRLFVRKEKNSLFSCYFFALFRHVDTYTYFFILLIIYGMLFYAQIPFSYFTLAILSINGVYAFVQTKDLRFLLLHHRYSPIKDFLYLILGQMSTILVLSIPIFILTLIQTKSLWFCVILYPSMLFCVLFFTMVGILFPPKNENPFSVFIGMLVVLLFLFALLCLCFVFHLELIPSILIFTCSTIAAIFLSILGLNKLHVEQRY